MNLARPDPMRALRTARLVLEPMVVAHADALFDVVADPTLYRHIDEPPPASREALRARHRRVEGRRSPDDAATWLNWVVFACDDTTPPPVRPLGFVQASIDDATVPRAAEIAYLFGVASQRRGFAREATRAMIDHLRDAWRVERAVATVDARHHASSTLLERLGFEAVPDAARPPGIASTDRRLVLDLTPMPSPRRSLGLVSLVVRDYDEALAFYVGKLGFELVEDTPIPAQQKRWVVVRPGGGGADLLLARASSPEQVARIGDQTGGHRVFLFLDTDDFARDHAAWTAAGVVFVGPPRHEDYGTVAVFEDLYGNRWDLIERRATR